MLLSASLLLLADVLPHVFSCCHSLLSVACVPTIAGVPAIVGVPSASAGIPAFAGVLAAVSVPPLLLPLVNYLFYQDNICLSYRSIEYQTENII
jgi:hypothetical protein